MNPKLSTLVALAVLVSACAQQPARQAESPAPAPEKAAAKPPLKAPELPKQELTEKLLFEFLLAEMAWQQGNPEVAAGTYLELAKSTRDPRVAQRATELALHAKQRSTALEAASLWLELDPNSVSAQQTVSALLVSAGKLDEARPHLEKLLATEGDAVGQGFLQLNGLLARHPDKTAVLKLAQDLAKPYPRVPEAHLAVAQAAWNARQEDLALAEAKEAGALRPEWELPALFQAQVLARRSNAQAGEFLQDYLKKYPKARDVRLNYARLLVSEKNYAVARAQFQQLMADYPANAEVTLAVGLLSMQLKDYDLAEATLKKVLGLEYKDLDAVRFYLGQLSEDRKRYDEAMSWYLSVRSGGQFMTAQIRYAVLLAKQGKMDEARRHIRELPAQDKQQRAQLIMAEAQLLREARQYQEAFDLLGQGLEKLPNYPDLLYDYAMAAEKIDRLDVLEQNLRKLIQLEPEHAHAYNALGYSLADRNLRLQEAYKLIEKAVELAPDDPFIMDSMGWVQYRLGNFAEGVNYLRRAFAARPDPEIAAHLGEVLWVEGDKDEAKHVWNSALKDNPDNEILLKTVKRFIP